MEEMEKKAAEGKENASQIMESVIKGSRNLVEISEPLLKNEKSKAILESLILDGNYGIQSYQRRLENKIFRIGILSNQSCGKSFLFNTLLGRPILPVADLRTSSAKLQIIYGKHCYIDVNSYEKQEIMEDGIEKQIVVERKVCTIDCEKTDKKTINELKEFVCHCYKVIDLQNIWYFLPSEINTDEITPKNAEKLEINPDEPWHMAFLWMTLLTAYINQNEDSEKLKEEWNRAVSARKKLYENLGLDSEIDYDITLYLDNPFLASGISLLDLPGVGAAVKSTRKAKSHDQITTEAVRDTDAIIVATDKTIMGGAVNKALDPLLQCAQFKYEGSRENRIIPLLTKVDTITGRGIRQQMENIKDAFITEILQPNNITLAKDEIHCVSALNAEYVFCENAGIPYDRCALVADLKLCNTLEDMKVKYEEASYIPEFSAFLQDYAVRGQIMTSSELFAQCIVYAQKCVDILEGQLEDGLISLEFFENISEDILKCLTDIMNESFADIIDRITGETDGIIDRYMKELEKICERLKNEINKEVHKTLKNEIQTAKDDLMKDARSLPANLWGDVVLFRKDKKGNITYETAYYDCLSMIDDFSNTNYNNTQIAILQSMSKAIQGISKVLMQMDGEIVEAYADLNKKFNNLMKQVEIRFKDNNLNPDSRFVKNLIDRCQQIVKVNADIKGDLAFVNSTQDLEQDFRKGSLGLISSFIANMSKIAKDIKEQYTNTGFFRTRTTVIYYSFFVNQLDNEIKVTASADNVCADIVGEIDRLFNSFFSAIKLKKGAPAITPCKNMMNMTVEMKDNLLISKGSDEAVIRERLNQIWEKYCGFVGEANTTYREMCSSFDEIRKDDGSFSVLVSAYIRKTIKVKENLPERVKKTLEISEQEVN